jgi:hypothetical protein
MLCVVCFQLPGVYSLNSQVVIDETMQGGQVESALFVVVKRANQPPEARSIPPATYRVAERVRTDMSVHFSDSDNHVLGFSVDGLPAGSGLAIDHISGVVSGQPNMMDFGASQPVNINIIASDGHGGTARAHFVMSILQANTAPVPVQTSQGSVNVKLGQPVFWPAGEFFSDPDKDVLTYFLGGLSQGTGFRIDKNTGLVTGSLNLAVVSTDSTAMCCLLSTSIVCSLLFSVFHPLSPNYVYCVLDKAEEIFTVRAVSIS